MLTLCVCVSLSSPGIVERGHEGDDQVHLRPQMLQRCPGHQGVHFCVQGLFRDQVYSNRYFIHFLQEFYPEKKPLEAKAKKDYGESAFLHLNF